ncbi:uncharacterized protein [Chanodichthys erythropterus]|uniref:uncharacterized protein isoform X2 n=1 Tax=Chanodichthys erythropterus TaxID=933992 RepID=UPI00351DB258
MSISAQVLYKHQVPLSAQEQGHGRNVVLKQPVYKLEPTVRTQAAVILKRWELRRIQEMLITDPSIIAVCSSGAVRYHSEFRREWRGYTTLIAQSVEGWRPYIDRETKAVSAAKTNLRHTSDNDTFIRRTKRSTTVLVTPMQGLTENIFTIIEGTSVRFDCNPFEKNCPGCGNQDDSGVGSGSRHRNGKSTADKPEPPLHC